MFSIGEFARLGAVSIRTLRHYDEIGLLPPAEVDPVTGYRSYSAKQLRQPAELPPPAQYQVLPAIEAAAAARSGPAASIYPMVYQDLVTWLQAHGFQPHWPGRRDIWIHEVDDISEVDQQVFEAQLAFTRPAADPAEERP